jgi:hypothetical protein
MSPVPSRIIEPGSGTAPPPVEPPESPPLESPSEGVSHPHTSSVQIVGKSSVIVGAVDSWGNVRATLLVGSGTAAPPEVLCSPGSDVAFDGSLVSTDCGLVINRGEWVAAFPGAPKPEPPNPAVPPPMPGA